MLGMSTRWIESRGFREEGNWQSRGSTLTDSDTRERKTPVAFRMIKKKH